MIETHKAWIGKNGTFQVVHCMLSGVDPDWSNRVCVVAFDDELMQGCCNLQSSDE